MASESQTFADSGTSLQQLLGLMRRLLQTPDGQSVYRRIERGSRVCEDFGQQLEQRFLQYLDHELACSCQGEDLEPSTRLIVRLIRRRLAPFLAQNWRVTDPGLEGLGADMAGVVAQVASVELWNQAANEKSREMEAEQARYNPSARNLMLPDLQSGRRELDRHYDDLRASFEHSQRQNRDFLNNLKTVRLAINDKNAGNDVDELRPVLLAAIDEITEWQEALMQQLSEANEFLDTARSGSVWLHEEINKVRELTQTDESTGLPNRDAFLRRMYGEMQRARRFRHPLSVCLIGLDLGATGHLDDGAVEALVVYADNVISRFRAYDIVARTGELQFGILLPGTGAEGAFRALEEAQHRAARSSQSGGDAIVLPSFHGGVATMHPNDAPDELLHRAETAFRSASRKGSGALEIVAGEQQRLSPERAETA
ncbi:MAG: GGDEF domain-containing protein [Gammaproteobacteria bacterium]|nr:GGDEF domain-containing protein [Gammaproteobacteria bacterium]